MNVLAIDIGGTHIKFCTQRQREVIALPSGLSNALEADYVCWAAAMPNA